MSHHRSAVRVGALGFVVALLLSASLPMAALAKRPDTAALGQHDERLLSDAVAKGRAQVTILVAARGGEARAAAKAISAAGGTINYRDDALGYLRATVATGKVREIAAAPGVEAVDLDETVEVPDPRPEGIQPLQPQPVPDATTPRANPYMPTQDTGAAAFVEDHPEWDGRGVTIGIVDTGVSLDHPSLLTTSTGGRKVVDWVTGTDPLTDPDPTWIDMAAQVSGASFTFDGRSYTAPAGSYRIGAFKENQPTFGGEFSVAPTPGGDLNRDGDETDIFGVLWDTAANQVWVDTDADGDFADEAAMTDYSTNFDVGRFGTDDAATDEIDEVPFVVQTDGANKFVNIGIIAGAHGSHVTGIASGNALFGGEMSGAAPGAQVVSSRACLFVAGCTGHALLEGMIYVAKQANADVINMSIGGLPALNDGNNTRCTVYARLIAQEKVQMYISIGNSGPGVNTAGDPGLCSTVVGMGAYLTDDTMLSDYGVEVGFQDNLHLFSSRGPREDGGFAPSAVAPGAAISSIPMWQPQGCLAQECPVGYALFNGTSMAAPQATGVGALLVSAANATGAQSRPEQIRQSLMSTSRYLTAGDRFQAYDQGTGLLDVSAAWDLLSQNLTPVNIVGRVPVSSALSDFLAEPGVGNGIYDREGVVLGEPYTRTYTLTRTDGPGGSKTYDVSWVGNDGTFSAPAQVTLPKGAAQELVVQINPSAAGAHSAILQLDDATTVGIDYQSMNTVIVPHTFSAENGFSVTESGTIDRAQALHFFFEVPAGAPAFKVDLTGGGEATGAGQIRFLRWTPWGLGIDSNAVSNCYNPPATTQNPCNPGSFAVAGQNPLSRTVVDPMAGVWEVSVDTRRTSDADDAPFSITASVLGASVSPDPHVIPSATAGAPVAQDYTITNLFGAFTGRAVGTDLGSAVIDTPTIADGALHQFEVAVPAGAASLRATIGSPGDPAADLDLFVVRPNGSLGGQSADGDSEESVTIANPVEGTWTVLVDGFAVPAGTTTYEYVDVFFTSTPMGSIDITDANAVRPAGESWTVPGMVTADTAPEEGRVLYGNVEVRTDEDILVGRGDVIVESVVAP